VSEVTEPTDPVDWNRHQMRAMLRMFETGNLEGVEAVIAADYLDHQTGGEDIGEGTAAFGRVVQGARRFSAPTITVKDLVADADCVAVRLVWEWERPPGRRETIDLIRFQDGLAKEHWGTPLT
jgi:predicted SnoaL-like aldol condensation-catalyzing enzyme